MKTAKTLSWIIAAAGLWEIIAPFAIGYSATSAAMVDAIILGVLLLGLGIWAALVNTSVTIKVLSWIDAVLGLWLVVAPFALCNEHEGEPALGRNGYLIHLVRHQDVIVHDVVEKERCAL